CVGRIRPPGGGFTALFIGPLGCSCPFVVAQVFTRAVGWALTFQLRSQISELCVAAQRRPYWQHASSYCFLAAQNFAEKSDRIFSKTIASSRAERSAWLSAESGSRRFWGRRALASLCSES